MDEHQRIGCLAAQGCPDGFTEEIGGHHDVHMQLDELSPGCLNALGGVTIGVREEVLFFENSPYGCAAGCECKLLEFAQNSTYAPVGVLPGHADDDRS